MSMNGNKPKTAMGMYKGRVAMFYKSAKSNHYYKVPADKKKRKALQELMNREASDYSKVRAYQKNK